jgi:hypothetical protein
MGVGGTARRARGGDSGQPKKAKQGLEGTAWDHLGKCANSDCLTRGVHLNPLCQFLCQFGHLTWLVLTHFAVILGILGIALNAFPDCRFGRNPRGIRPGAFGPGPEWGSGGREFESHRPDQFNQSFTAIDGVKLRPLRDVQGVATHSLRPSSFSNQFRRSDAPTDATNLAIIPSLGHLSPHLEPSSLAY